MAAAQSGYVTTQQAAAGGYSTHLLRKHIHAGRVTRPQRGIYRLVRFPAGEHEELVMAWLWSEQVGVLSHRCATDGLSPDLLRQAALHAIGRGLVTKRELGDVETALEPFGGLAA